MTQAIRAASFLSSACGPVDGEKASGPGLASTEGRKLLPKVRLSHSLSSFPEPLRSPAGEAETIPHDRAVAFGWLITWRVSPRSQWGSGLHALGSTEAQIERVVAVSSWGGAYRVPTLLNTQETTAVIHSQSPRSGPPGGIFIFVFLGRYSPKASSPLVWFLLSLLGTQRLGLFPVFIFLPFWPWTLPCSPSCFPSPSTLSLPSPAAPWRCPQGRKGEGIEGKAREPWGHWEPLTEREMGVLGCWGGV